MSYSDNCQSFLRYLTIKRDLAKEQSEPLLIQRPFEEWELCDIVAALTDFYGRHPAVNTEENNPET